MNIKFEARRNLHEWPSEYFSIVTDNGPAFEVNAVVPLVASLENAKRSGLILDYKPCLGFWEGNQEFSYLVFHNGPISRYRAESALESLAWLYGQAAILHIDRAATLNTLVFNPRFKSQERWTVGVGEIVSDWTPTGPSTLYCGKYYQFNVGGNNGN